MPEDDVTARTGSPLRPVAGAATDVGRSRAVNEDGYVVLDPAFLVVDGMGGHAAGRAATRAALPPLSELGGRSVESVQEVVDAVVRAGEAVAAVPSHAAFLPGATMAGAVLARIDGRDTWIVVNVGDSRVYLLRDGALEQVSHDHSQVQALVDSGRLTRAEAHRDPRRNVVTRALGAGLEGPALPELSCLAALPGDRLLICSDGLSDELDDDELRTVLGAGLSPQRTAETAIAAALEAGGRDNITAVIVDLLVGE